MELVEFGLYSADTEPGHWVTVFLGHRVTKSDPVPYVVFTCIEL